jgi:hypothetical protein
MHKYHHCTGRIAESQFAITATLETEEYQSRPYTKMTWYIFVVRGKDVYTEILSNASEQYSILNTLKPTCTVTKLAIVVDTATKMDMVVMVVDAATNISS